MQRVKVLIEAAKLAFAGPGPTWTWPSMLPGGPVDTALVKALRMWHSSPCWPDFSMKGLSCRSLATKEMSSGPAETELAEALRLLREQT